MAARGLVSFPVAGGHNPRIIALRTVAKLGQIMAHARAEQLQTDKSRRVERVDKSPERARYGQVWIIHRYQIGGNAHAVITTENSSITSPD